MKNYKRYSKDIWCFFRLEPKTSCLYAKTSYLYGTTRPTSERPPFSSATAIGFTSSGKSPSCPLCPAHLSGVFPLDTALQDWSRTRMLLVTYLSVLVRFTSSKTPPFCRRCLAYLWNFLPSDTLCPQSAAGSILRPRDFALQAAPALCRRCPAYLYNQFL